MLDQNVQCGNAVPLGLNGAQISADDFGGGVLATRQVSGAIHHQGFHERV
jgi:hypothetical protein